MLLFKGVSTRHGEKVPNFPPQKNPTSPRFPKESAPVLSWNNPRWPKLHERLLERYTWESPQQMPWELKGTTQPPNPPGNKKLFGDSFGTMIVSGGNQRPPNNKKSWEFQGSPIPLLRGYEAHHRESPQISHFVGDTWHWGVGPLYLHEDIFPSMYQRCFCSSWINYDARSCSLMLHP